MRRAKIFHRDPGILGGTPVFTGARVPVDTLVHDLKHGMRLEAFPGDFPSVGRAQAEAFPERAES
ncbi:DUF433 domain-containing protein [Rhodocaloribacter sp.]